MVKIIKMYCVSQFDDWNAILLSVFTRPCISPLGLIYLLVAMAYP